MKKIAIVSVGVFSIIFSPLLANAHVTVKPAVVGAAAFQTFTVGVPNEKDIPTTAVRLVIPEGLHHVMPNVKSGWKIEVKKEKTGAQVTDEEGNTIDEERVSEIVWSGGSVPVGQREEFAFSAQVPAEESVIAWRAYQTYAGGTVVSWDQEGVHDHDFKYPDNTGPYSKTTVTDDLGAEMHDEHHESSISIELIISLLALVVSVSAYLRANRAS